MAPDRWWSIVRLRLRSLFQGTRVDADLDDELRDHVEPETAAGVARGLPPAAARTAALRAVGGVEAVKDACRDERRVQIIDTSIRDLRYATRGLRAAPGFTAVVILTLALGIGGTTAIFSAVKPILLEPLSYPDAGRLVMIWETRPDASRVDGTFGMYRWLVERSRPFETLAVFKPWQPTVTGTNEPERLAGQRVSASYFQVLGVPPALGRDFEAADDLPNAPAAVILSDGLWRRLFAGDRGIIGRQVTLDGIGTLVVGVMPAGFENVLAPSSELWAPLQYEVSQGRAWGHHLRAVGRLHPRIGVAPASREIEGLGQAALKELRPPTYGRSVAFVVTSLAADVTRGVRPALLAVAGGVTLVLVIACVNVTNLLLARCVRRRGEFALRIALGAARGRLLRQLLTESLLLALIGGIVGLVVSDLGVRALVALSPPGLPRVGTIRVDGVVFAFGLAVTAIIGVMAGLIPALRAARHDPLPDLQRGSRRIGGGPRRTRQALVVAEVALALVLLVGSGLLFRSLQRLFAVPVGFNSSNLLTMQVQTAGRRFAEPAVAVGFFTAVLDAARHVPGVTAAALTSQLPLSGDRDEYGVHFESNPNEGDSTFRYAVSPGFLEVMGIPLRSGRVLDEGDRADTPLVALVSESLARRRFPTESPIGRRLRIGPASGPPFTVVGIVGDLKQMSLAGSESDAVYTTAAQSPVADMAMSLVVRSDGDAAALGSAVRQAVWSVDKDQPVARVATLDGLLAAAAAERRFALTLFEAFALAALVLAAAGLYGVLAAGVAERTREIGVRAVLGATRREIVALVVRQGLTLTGLGVVIGLVGAALASEVLITMLFRTSRLDPATYLGVLTLLVVVTIVASAVPAWRAARVDPAVTLKAE